MACSRIRISAQELVAHEIGPIPITPSLLEEAFTRVRRRGFAPSFIPSPETYHQHMILVHDSHPFASLYRALAGDGSPTPVSCDAIEGLTRFPISHVITGMTLARYGLAILRTADGCVILRGTSSEMAYDANMSRYTDPTLDSCWMLVERALGMVVPPFAIDEDLRLRTAQVYDLHNIEVDGLLDGANDCTLVSPWRFPQSESKSKKD